MSLPALENIPNMTLREIEDTLSSKYYIPYTFREKLEARLKLLQESHTHTTFSDLFKTVSLAKNNKKKPSKEFPPIEGFPLIPPISSMVNDPTSTQNQSSISSAYSKHSIKNENNTKENNTKENINNFDYQLIRNLYQHAAAMRIKALYHDLSRTVHLLNSVRASHNKLWREIHGRFNYDVLVNKLSRTQNIINICNQLETLIVNSQTQGTLGPDLQKNICDSITDDLDFLFKSDRTLNDLFCKFQSPSLSNKQLVTTAEALVNTIINKSDPKINCQYIVTLESNGSNTSINLDGIVYNGHSYTTDQPMELLLTDYSDSILRKINVLDIEKMLHGPFKTGHLDLLVLSDYTLSSISHIYIYFNFDSNLDSDCNIDAETASKYTDIINFFNKPNDVKCVMYIHKQLSEKEEQTKKEFYKLYPNISRVNPYLVTDDDIISWSSDIYMDPDFDLTYDEYINLPIEIRQKYDFEQTSQNSFTVDYLFNELLKSDKSIGLVTPSMRDSFLKLAYETTL